MRRAAIILLTLAILSGCGKVKEAEEGIENIIQEKPGTFSCIFDGVKHSFLLELPEEAENAPLVMMLPGYGNTAEAFRLQTQVEVEANAHGYAVVYVTGAPDPDSPGSSTGWNSESGTGGNRDVEFICALARYLQDEYSLDKTSLFAVGFSNGAFMVHRLAMETEGIFAAYVSVAGFMSGSVWNERRETNSAGFFQITGEKDDVVPKKSDGSAAYSKAPAIEDVMEYWAGSNGLEHFENAQIGNGSVLTKYSSGDRPQQVWHLLVSDGRHSWPSRSYNKIDTNGLIMEFLESQTNNLSGSK